MARYAVRSEPRSPVVPPLRLADLEPGAAGMLRAGGHVDLIRLTGIDISGADLTGIELDECELIDMRADSARLVACRVTNTRIERLSASELTAQRSSWREVTLAASRVGALIMYDVQWRSVAVEGCKISFLNLGGANLLDVVVRDCVIDTLDLTAAVLSRVAFEDCRVGALRLHGGSLSDVDLRGMEMRVVSGIGSLAGVTISSGQLTELAPLLAQHLGLRVEDRNHGQDCDTTRGRRA